ncbi:hypothetical protein Tco_1270415 [Tanacetum coccineum]
MATTFSPTSSITLHHNHRPFHILQSNRNSIFATIRCSVQKDNSTSTNSSESENLFLKTAWYGSELLGIAASSFRSRDNVVAGGEGNIELGVDGVGVIDKSVIVETIKQDFQSSYFVTGITQTSHSV